MVSAKWDRRAWLLLAFWSVIIAAKAVAVYWLREEPFRDSALYLALGRSLAAGDGLTGGTGYPTGLVVPGYPLLLAATLRLLGDQMISVYLVNVPLTLVVAYAYGRLAVLLTGRDVLFHFCAALVFAFPPYIYHAGRIMTEIPYSMWLALSLLFFEKTRRQPDSILCWSLLGLFHVIALLTRPVAFLVTPVVLGWPLVEARFRRRPLVGACLATAIILALWLPWVARNQRVFGEPVLLSTLSGKSLLAGSLSNYRLFSEAAVSILEEADFEGTGPDAELERDRILGKAAKENILRDVPGYVTTSVKRSWHFWYLEYGPHLGLTRRYRDYLSDGDYALFALRLGLLGLNVLMSLGWIVALAVLWRNKAVWPYYLFIVYFWVMHALMLPLPRYNVPIAGLCLVLIICAFSETYGMWVARRERNAV